MISPIGQINGEARAERAWKRIQRSPSRVVFVRNGVTQAVQTLRVELGNGGSSVGLPTGTIGVQGGVIYGIRDHKTLPDTNVKRLDRVVIEGKEYTVETIVKPPGEIQAFVVARG